MNLRRIVMTALASAILAASPASLPAQAFTAPPPEDLMIYFIFTDRFENGDFMNDDGNPRGPYAPSTPSGWHGGDIEGIRQRLSYIRGMGFNAIWMTPFVENVREYHGYAAYNWYNVDPNFGNLAKMQQMVAEANAQGIAVYFDMVVNHCGDLINSSDSGYPSYRTPPSSYTLRWRNASLQYPPPFNNLTFFHAQGNIGNFSAPEQELGELSGLDDLKTETQAVRDAMFNIWDYWLTNTGVSGFRIDTVKHTEMGFWQDFLPRMSARAAALGRSNYFTFGEIYGADDNYMAQYVGTLNGSPYKLDAALDFQFYYTAGGVFARGVSPTSDFTNRMVSRASRLGAHTYKTPNFLDNHDVPRFLNAAAAVPGTGLAERRRRLELALVAMFTSPGPPVMYYGTEQDFDGGNDPYNREDMFDGQFEQGPSLGNNFNVASPRYRLVKRLAALRSSIEALRRGNIVPRQTNSAGAGVLAYSRATLTSENVIVMNTSMSTATQNTFGTTIPAGTVLYNALDPSQSVTIGAGGVFPARSLPGQAAEIWVREAELPPSVPEVSAASPLGGSSNVDPATDVTVRFSVPMNRTTTEGAVTLAPATAVVATWESGDTVLRLNPVSNLVPRTTYTVSVTAAATSATGAAIDAAFSSSFTTGRDLSTLPALPSAFPTLVERAAGQVTVDGNGAEWASAATGSDTGTVTPADVFVWRDATGDDIGAGGYTYPTNTVFTGGDADIAEVRVAFDASNVYFYLRPVSLNPAASFYTAYFGIGIDTRDGGRTGPLGYDQSTGAAGGSKLIVRPDAAPEYELVFTGPRLATLLGDSGTPLGATTPAAYSQSTGEVEIAVPRSALTLQGTLANQRFNLIVYSGLETFGTLRDVQQSSADWTPGGGSMTAQDPNVFDLAGATSTSQQTLDLSDYDAVTQSMVARSIIPLRLSTTRPPAGVREWTMY